MSRDGRGRRADLLTIGLHEHAPRYDGRWRRTIGIVGRGVRTLMVLPWRSNTYTARAKPSATMRTSTTAPQTAKPISSLRVRSVSRA